MKVTNSLERQFQKYQKEFEDKALNVLRSGWYILGEELKSFECEFANYLNIKHCVGLASGLDALWIACKMLGIGEGDEVIIQANAYIASVMGITINGATPIFVEPDEYFNIDVSKIEKSITNKTKAILVVHLYGQASNMTEIMRIARKYNLKVVEDCAQSHGALHNGQQTGTFGDIGCFSFYPSKNLGAFGDGGCIVTNDDIIAQKVRTFRNYGSQKRYHNEVVGSNSRLDELQAGLLRVKLTHLDELNNERVYYCERYLSEINNPFIQLPTTLNSSSTVWHQFVIKTDYREELIDYLNNAGISTIIHYPIPPHLSEAYAYLGYKKGDFPITEEISDKILSLPLYNGMSDEELQYVIDIINDFKKYTK